jgi:hypothetical protein
VNKRHVVGLLVLLVAFSGLVVTCKKTTDPQSDSSSAAAYGEYPPPFNPAGVKDKTTCQAQCNEYYTELMQEEIARHKQALKDCDKRDSECKDAENELFAENKEAIAQARELCVSECHDQGDTGGGF